MKLPKAVKHKWLAALRSGKYLQATSALRKQRDDGKIGYCCLGVACAIGIAKKDDERLPLRENGYVKESFLPSETQKRLAVMNDNGTSFEKIASWISRNL